MTVTNDERRAVAGYIRQIDCSGFTPHSMDDGGGRSLLCAYIAEAVGVGHAPYYFDAKPLCARLADLIEPEPERTCHMRDAHWDDGQCTWGCICSECGAKHEHKSGKWMNYCPNCGAKVVAE
ncbi:hypothetical protein [Collinsella tanakaei]|uniref:hypothetical protein n=1 Tax=Collinsella tanakaei TaxID=626935 RepID=UPI00248DF2BB|nr:hypothetical protein [Collinsella tanakaei]